jgi:8-oxo-dGTP pyrophosphatase MutT (NUDIX family)
MTHIHEKIDFVVVAFLIRANKVLLVHHIETNKWLPVGGHIELDENPDQALFREIEEETGLKKGNLKILSQKFPFKDKNFKFLYTPNYLDIHVINPRHRHVGLTYIVISKTVKVHLKQDEHYQIRWFSADDIENRKYKISTNVKFYARMILKIVSNNKKLNDKKTSIQKLPYKL